ncbi:MAG: tRNA (adenosine(37)-N6)-threonylcarbamoyltransferase complex dimerization subunit type 1 TsaB [Syntrophorhabdaceae bacterium]
MANEYRLALDNSLDLLNVTLAGPCGSIDEINTKESRSPSQIIPEKIDEILVKNGISFAGVSELITTLGPGSFTGIRVALAFCKGIRAATGLPIRGIPTLDALAFRLIEKEGSYLCPVVDARKSEVFSALYHVTGGKLIRLTGYMAIKPADVPHIIKTPCFCFGSGLRVCETFLSPINGVTLLHGFDNIKGECLVDKRLSVTYDTLPNRLQPIYGRRSEAEIKFGITID